MLQITSPRRPIKLFEMKEMSHQKVITTKHKTNTGINGEEVHQGLQIVLPFTF